MGYHQNIRDAQAKLEDEQRTKEVVRDALLGNERRANAAQNALEEARTLLEQADRARRLTEQELSDTNEQLSDQTVMNQGIAGAKRKIESEMQTLHGDLDEMASEAHLSDAKAQKAMVDAARLADELRAEQEIALAYERDRKLLECQAKDLQQRLDEAETNALKGGKKAMNKMDTRIRELEAEVDAESRRLADAAKNLRKSERRIKELTYASDEDRKNQERMQALVDQLQSKIKTVTVEVPDSVVGSSLIHTLDRFERMTVRTGEGEVFRVLGHVALFWHHQILFGQRKKDDHRGRYGYAEPKHCDFILSPVSTEPSVYVLVW